MFLFSFYKQERTYNLMWMFDWLIPYCHEIVFLILGRGTYDIFRITENVEPTPKKKEAILINRCAAHPRGLLYVLAENLKFKTYVKIFSHKNSDDIRGQTCRKFFNYLGTYDSVEIDFSAINFFTWNQICQILNPENHHLDIFHRL